MKTSDSGLYFQIYCAEKKKLRYILMVLWIIVCAFGRRLQSKNLFTMFQWWLECGGGRTHSAEAFLSCQMFSLKPTCTVRLGFSLPTFSAGCMWASVGVSYLSVGTEGLA